jgi:simple sugar transport system ATP-binding protein
MKEVSLEVIGETGIQLHSANTLVTDLSGGQQQAVAIARSLAFDAKIIIMDEPTASLSVKAIPPLLELMNQFRAKGKSMIFITHRIQDIFSTCDRVMVLRRGHSVGVSSIENTTVDEVTGLITGRIESFGSRPDHQPH